MLWNAFLLALREIRRNVLRSFLTTLGIVIGVAAVITMVTVGRGATAQVTADIAKLGSNMLIVRPGQRRGPGGAAAGAPSFDVADATALARQVGALTAVAPAASRSAVAVYGNTNWSTAVTGTTNAFLDVRDWTLASGRAFTAGELRAGAAVCLIGETVSRELFGGADPVGRTIRLHKVSCEIIGLLEPKGQTGMGRDQDDLVLVPLRMFQRRFAGNRDVDTLYVSVDPAVSTEKATRDIGALLRERRHIAPTEDDNFSVLDMKEIASTLTGTTRLLTGLLGAVASVSLLVGGIGIMNIMLVSVTERTREIGIRLAIGALERDVLRQFLVEAVVLAASGGVLGIGLALAASAGLARALNIPFLVDPMIVLGAFLFSATVGVAFGYLPAQKAARLDPIEALRHE